MNDKIIECQPYCAACCIAPSITSSIPGMPHGKQAGMRCVQLDEELNCKLFGLPSRPKVCVNFQARESLCDKGREHAMQVLNDLEKLTS